MINRFARQYFLPCRHIFHLDGETKVLTPERWQTYVSLFDECGFEVYETMGRVYVEVEERQMDNVRIRSVLQLRELEERLRQQLYTVHDMIEEENIQEDDHRTIVENWMSFVNEVVEPLADVLPEYIVKKNGRPWEL